jgi:hypothetical protein
MYQCLRPNIETRVGRYDGTLDFQQEEDVAWPTGKRLEVALSFRDDDVRTFKSLPECSAALFQDGSGCIGTVVDQPRDLVQARKARVGQRGVIEYCCTADCHRNPLGGEALDQQPVENDLTCVIGKV